MLPLLKNVVVHRSLLWNFIGRDLKVRYRGTVFGYMWSLLEPMAQVLVYYFLFTTVLRRGTEDYPLVVILGVLPYGFFTAVVQGGAVCLVSNANLIKKIYLPRELFLFGLVGSNLIFLVLSLLVVVPFLVYYGVGLGATVLWVPVSVFLLALFASGVGFVVACLNVLYRDVAYVLRVALRILFYGSPVIYPISMVPERLLDVYLLNPVAACLAMMRAGLMNRPLALSSASLGIAAGVSVASFVVGAFVFARYERFVVKYL